MAFDNGTVQTLSYDSRYRLRENVLTTATRTLARYVYRYDAAGNITAIDDTLEPVYNRIFAYDDLNRLVTADTGPALWQKGSYTWDAMGNPLAIKLGEVVPGDGDGLLRTGPRIVTDSQWRPGGRTQFGMQRTVNCNCKEDDCEKSWPDKLKDWWKEFTDPNKPPLPPLIPIPPKLPTPKPVIPGLPPFFINPCMLNPSLCDDGTGIA